MIGDQIHEFARGASFEAIMSLPANIADNYFADWTATSQIRKAGTITDDGLIGNLIHAWLDGRQFVLTNNNTDEWPLGMAEVDVLFTHPSNGRKIRTKKLSVKINHGTTRA